MSECTHAICGTISADSEKCERCGQWRPRPQVFQLDARPLVFGLGLPRTGTSSLRAAMAELGWRVQTDPNEDERLKLLFDGRVREAVERDLARGFTYLSEPYWAFAGEVRAAYPEAPVIYTVRDYVSWRASLRAFLADRPRRSRPHWAMPRPEHGAEVRILASLIWGVWLPWLTPTAAWWRAMASTPKGAALDVCKGEGWEELLDVLCWQGCGVANTGGPFPHRNATPTRARLEDG